MERESVVLSKLEVDERKAIDRWEVVMWERCRLSGLDVMVEVVN